MAQAQEVFLFQPTSIPGCQLWLDAADRTSFTLTGSTLASITDKSGTGKTITVNSAPTYNATIFNNLPSFVFAGGNRLSATTAALGRTMTLIAAYRVTGSIGGSFGNAVPLTVGLSFSGNETGLGFNPSFPAYNIYDFGVGESLNSSITTSNVNLIHIGVKTSSNLTSFVNGNSATPANSTYSNANTAINIGGGGFAFVGNLAEAIVYSTPLTTSQRQQIEGYLAWKWGLQANLPANHPFKTYRPLAQTPIPTSIPPMPTIGQTNQVFVPTQISGCQLWLDGTDVNGNGTTVANGASISTWVDKSGQRNNATATVAPTYDAATRYVLFNGSSQFFNLPNGTYPFGNTPYSIFTVSYTRNAANPQWVLAGGTSVTNQAIGLLYYFTNAVWHSWWVNEYRVDNSITNNVPAIINISYQTTRSIVVNGGTPSINNPAATRNNANTPNYIGRRPDTAVEFFNGGIAECIVFNSEIPTSQRQQVEGYLAWKWGLTANLPNGHPYKTQQIAPFSFRTTAFRGGLNSWQPTQISGCQVWFDGADVNGNGTSLANGATVSTWVDKSGLGNNATASVAASYSNGGVYFNNSYYTTNYTGSPTFETSFIVFNKPSVSDAITNTLIGSTTGGREIGIGTNPGSGLGQYTIMNAATAFGGTSGPGTVLANTRAFGVATVNSGSTAVALNGGNFSASVTLTYTAGRLTQLGRENGTSFGYVGFAFEILFYNSVLSVKQRQQVEGYLAWKWGLVGSLPANHPFKLFPPPP